MRTYLQWGEENRGKKVMKGNRSGFTLEETQEVCFCQEETWQDGVQTEEIIGGMILPAGRGHKRLKIALERNKGFWLFYLFVLVLK